MAAIIRAFPLYVNDQKVAEAAQTTEDRTVNGANQYGVDGVLGQSIGAEETKVSFDTIIPVEGMGLSVDDLIGQQITIGIPRNGRYFASVGLLNSSNYTSDSKTGEAKGKFEFIGGPALIL